MKFEYPVVARIELVTEAITGNVQDGYQEEGEA